MNMNQKRFAKIVVVVVVVAIVAAAGYFAFVKKSEPIAQQPTPTPTNENANLKTYTNTQYGFSFQYPGVYKLSDKLVDYLPPDKVRVSFFGIGLVETSKDINEGSPFISIGVWNNLKNLSLTDWAKAYPNSSFSNFGEKRTADFKEIIIDGHKAISYSWEGLVYGKTVIIENNKEIFLFSIGSIDDNDPVWQDFDKLLSTFKFSK